MNVLFADNYYQDMLLPEGRSILGAFNRHLTYLTGGYDLSDFTSPYSGSTGFSFTTATAITWTGAAGSSDWFNPANWNPMAVPTAADAVVVNSGSVTVTANASFAVFNLNGGTLNGTFTVASTMDWSSGYVDAQLTVASGGVLNVTGSGGLGGVLVNGGTVNVAAGRS